MTCYAAKADCSSSPCKYDSKFILGPEFSHMAYPITLITANSSLHFVLYGYGTVQLSEYRHPGKV